MNTTNIFEQAAEIMKRNEVKAFAGNSPSGNYFQVGHTTEAKVVGRRYPQTAYINTAIAHLLEFRELSPYPIKFDRIELHKSAKLTDCISTAAISAHAFLLSKKALEIFRQFKLGTHTVYPATVFHK